MGEKSGIGAEPNIDDTSPTKLIALLISKSIPLSAPKPPGNKFPKPPGNKLLSPPPPNKPPIPPPDNKPPAAPAIPATLDKALRGEDPPAFAPASPDSPAAATTAGAIALSNPVIISLRTEPSTSPITSSVAHIGVGV